MSTWTAKRKVSPVVLVKIYNPQWHDIYRINLVTGAMVLLLQHDRFLGVTVDDDYRLRYAAQMTQDGSAALYRPEGADWKVWDTIAAEDMMTTSLIGFDKTNRYVFMTDSRGRDTSALMAVDVETKESRLLAADPQADVADMVCHPTEKSVQAKDIPVTYLLYPDEGHGFVRPENNLSFYAIAEQFLAKYLGVRQEPIGNDCEGASLQVLTGADDIPGLNEVLADK